MIKNLCFVVCAFFLTFSKAPLAAHMYHQKVIEENWVVDHLFPFDELIISWNAKRPTDGKYSFYVSVKVDEWSPWLLYATWGSDGQSSFKMLSENSPVRVFQDALEVLEGKKATGFQIRIFREDTCALDDIYGLHVYTNSDKVSESRSTVSAQKPVHLDMQGLSQMRLDHPRHADLCSSTSTSAVVRYLSNRLDVDPVCFAEGSWDSGFDIFGNWVFNVAQASTELGSNWDCWVERLSGFDEIYERLQQGMPVVVSVRGPLQGSALPYAQGHLLVVIGYDPTKERVVCMDPAFSSDEQTEVSYGLSDFVQAWNRRGRIAYIFSKAKTEKPPM